MEEEQDYPTLEECKAGTCIEKGCEGDCIYVGSVDMACIEDRNRTCPDDETCCQATKTSVASKI